MSRQNFKTGWINVDESGDPDYFVRLMDEVRGGKDDDPQQYRTVFDLIEARDGGRFLDVGCGTGGAVRALARLIGGAGRVVGVDKSQTMIAEAGRRAAGSGLPLEFVLGDAHQLPFGDGTFDSCFSLRVFEIVGDPRQALAEMARVTRAGGHILINGPDIDSWAIDADDRDVTRRLLHYVCDYETNGWVGRQLPALCHDLGLADIRILPTSVIVRELKPLRDFCLQAFVERAQGAGVLSAEEASGWMCDLERRDRAGKFFCGQTLFRLVARKP